jgi:hypothetical protein
MIKTLWPLTESSSFMLISPSLKRTVSCLPRDISRCDATSLLSKSPPNENILRSVCSHWSGEKNILDIVASSSYGVLGSVTHKKLYWCSWAKTSGNAQLRQPCHACLNILLIKRYYQPQNMSIIIHEQKNTNHQFKLNMANLYNSVYT